METEAKFELQSGETLRALRDQQRLGKYALRPEASRIDSDRYLDTPDLHFYSHGWSLRLRQRGHKRIATLKSLSPADGAIHERQELEVEVPGDDPEAWPPGEVRNLTLQTAAGQPLMELFSLDQQRSVSTLWDGEREVAEFSLDEVQFYGPAEDVRTVYEGEIELRPDGRPEDLQYLASSLTEGWNLKPQPLSKFERGLALLLEPEAREAAANISSEEVRVSLAEDTEMDATSPAESGTPAAPDEGTKEPAQSQPDKPKGGGPGVQREDTMAQAGRKVLGFHFQRMLDNEEGTRDGSDPEHLHDMRVATRRMRAALPVFEDAFDRDEVKMLRRGLRSTGRALGDVRDRDVMLDKAAKFRDSLPEDLQPGMNRLLDAWGAERTTLRSDMIDYLNSKRYDRFKRDMEDFLGQEAEDKGRAPGLQSDGTVEPVQVRHVAGHQILESYEAVCAYGPALPGAAITTLHMLRIECKHLRYTIEFFKEVLPGEAGGLIKVVTEAQDHLGELHDAQVAADLAAEFLMQELTRQRQEGAETPVSLVGVETYRQDRLAALQERVNGVPEIWANLTSRGFRSRLAGAIADLLA